MAAASTPTRPPAISQYWNTDEVPDYIAELSATFRDRNPDFHHRLFSESEAERFIAARFGAREAAAFRSCAIPSMQSDYFRYCSVLALGGFYVDADHRCSTSLRPLLDRCREGEIFLGPDARLLNGRHLHLVWSSFFVFRAPGHPFLALALELATANVEAKIPESVWPRGHNIREAVWATVGPGVFSLMRLMREWGSFDAFIAGIADSPIEPFGELYCDVVGDYDRLLEASEGVRVSSHQRMMDWIENPVEPLPYKQTDVHWLNATGAIFR